MSSYVKTYGSPSQMKKGRFAKLAKMTAAARRREARERARLFTEAGERDEEGLEVGRHLREASRGEEASRIVPGAAADVGFLSSILALVGLRRRSGRGR